MTTEQNPDFEALLIFLRDERGFDFTGYKRASLMRRVERRMGTVGVEDFDAYHDYLLVHPEEYVALFNTILINVTAFFRDPEAWAYLQDELLPSLLARRDGQPVRAWTAGCASGEEAYTLAMVFAEVMGEEEFRTRVKIYATDVDEEALALARHAAYTEHEVAGVPSELREKYFERHGQRFTFRKDLRRSVIFGRNDLVQDAPISHVDVLTCRNTMMYFNAETQAQILRRMHFALREDGVLFLGRAEMLLSHPGLFRPVELKRRFFRKVALPDGPRRLTGGALMQARSDGVLPQLRDAALLSSAAAQVVLDTEGRLALFNNRAALTFGLSPRDAGRPIQDLEISYRPIELRGHIEEALDQRRPVWVRDVTWKKGPSPTLSFDIQLLPLSDEAGDPLGLTVIFNDVTEYRQLQHELEFANRQLETAYEELQSTNEELETTNEELQSTIEELETTNEELQSTNEELETMNEELQSMNDELHLTNDALREERERAESSNTFMTMVLSSMNAGVAVFDQSLHVMAWNAKAEDLWGVRSEEAHGVHLFSLDIGLPLDQLRPVVKELLAGDRADPQTLLLEAVNRRGRPLQVRVTVTRLTDGSDVPSGGVLVMDPTGSAGGVEAAPGARREDR